MTARTIFGWAGLVGTMVSALGQSPRIPAGYRLETIEIPEGIVLGVGGLAQTPKGDLLISTREGEVWRYTHATSNWSLFADGLHEALGLYVDPKTSEVWVMERPELTKLVDEDGDGKADVYQTVAAGWGLADNYHEYAFGPVRDSKGNFYGTLNTTLSWVGWAGSARWDIGRVHDSKMGRAVPYRGWSFQVSPDGTFTPWSSGMRSPAGIGINSKDEIFYTDNQGDWNASSTLHQIKKGRFHGHPSSLMDHPDFKGKELNDISVADYAKMRALPVFYFPHGELASSPGEPIFDETGGKFGPFKGQIFVGDQTRSNMMRAYLDEVNGEYQGVVFNFIDPTQCGVIRCLFDRDGSLWVGQTGRGWRSVGEKLFGLQRVVWDGKTIPLEMWEVRLEKEGFRVNFTTEVKNRGAETFRVRHWGYLYRADYGSPKVDETEVKPTEVAWAADGRSALVKLPLEAGRVYQISTPGARGPGGEEMVNSHAYYTLNWLRK